MALVLTPFLLLAALIVTMGRAYYAQFMLLNIANTATRACTMQQQPLNQPQPPPDNSGVIIGCVNAVAQDLLTKQYTNVCGTNATVTPSPVVMSGVPGGTAPGVTTQVKMVTLTLSCRMAPFFATQMTAIPINARASMPFVN